MDSSIYGLLQQTFAQHLARRKLFPTRDERDDALHSSIVKFFEDGPDIPLTSKRALAWLTTTARRILLYRRRRDRYLFTEVAAAEEEQLLSSDNADDGAMRWTVGALLRELSEPHRAVMALRMEGLSRSEIARQLGLGKETVNKRLTRAIATLRTALRVDGVMREEARRHSKNTPHNNSDSTNNGGERKK